MNKERFWTTAFVLGVLAGPAFMVFALRTDPGYASRVGIGIVFVVALIVSVLGAAFSMVTKWIVEHPSAGLHEHEGVARLSLLALLAGPIWAVVKFSSYQPDPSMILLLALGLSLTCWFLVNACGWVAEGFKRKQ